MTPNNAVTMNENVFLMRHARFEIVVECIDPAEENICRSAVGELIPRLGERPVRILHSPRERADQTARIVYSELMSKGVEVEMGSEPLLNLSLFQVDKVVGACDKEEYVYLLITHEPDLVAFLGRERIPNCTIVGRDVEISRPEA